MIRIGIIGLGGMGRGHAGYLSAGEVPGATLAAIADVSPVAHEWAKTHLDDHVRRFETADAMMDSGGIDGVIVSTPHYYHPPLAIAALKRGLHALVEKPAGVYVKQVREMNEAAEASGRVFGIMFNQRTRAIHQKVKALVESGEIGEIRRTQYVITDWFRSQSYYDSGGWRATWSGEGGGVLVNQAPHNLDLWQWICGMPTRVRAFCGFGRFHNIEVEDDVTAYVEYANGANGVFITTTGEAPGSNSLEIIGDRGRLRMEGNTVTFWRTAQPVGEFLRTSPTGFAKPETWKCDIPVPGGEANEHRTITRNWVAAISEGKPLLAQGTEGIHGVQLANAMLLSAWTDDWAAVPTDEERFYQLLQEKIAASTFQKQSDGKALDFTGTF
ncbi:MAG: Gfo/Idh/MocA family oxidoreductase [Cytophagales bacterium]|nr:Gfo/Idh/MocA family oxidoreductase [Armatimonadota bacterium]